jgi:hypothetical protein
VDAIVQTRPFDGILVVRKLSRARHPPAAVRTVRVLVQKCDRNIVAIVHSFDGFW